jgi:DNA-binding CsgD family transcriptional regulator
MRPADVAECVRMIGEHPVIGPRYGKAISHLHAAWLHVLRCEAKAASVLEEVSGRKAKICLAGVSVFVRDEFVQELKRPPHFWIGPVLASRIRGRNSPMLSGRELREANSHGGLNLLVWEGCMRPEFVQHPEIYREGMAMFHRDHVGYFWKELISSQLESVERLQWTLDSGALLWNADRCRYAAASDVDLHEVINHPHVLGLTREAEHARLSSWVGALFQHRPPQIVFNRSEQQLLLAALSGATDAELSAHLGISLSTIKTTWRSAFNRTASHLPELFPDVDGDRGQSYLRGKEKRRHLLTYLRDHPEELRPVSRKLFRVKPKL